MTPGVRLGVWLLLVATTVSAVAGYLHTRDRLVAERAVAAERWTRDSAAIAVLAAGTRQLLAAREAAQARTDTDIVRWRTVVREVPVPVTHRESVYVQAVQSCDLVIRSCAAERAAADTTIGALRGLVALQDTTIRRLRLAPAPARRDVVQLGVGVGYGATYDVRRQRVAHGPTITVGLTITP